MVRFEAHKVVTETTAFDAELILFMPGMTGPQWVKNTSLPQSEGCMIVAQGNRIFCTNFDQI